MFVKVSKPKDWDHTLNVNPDQLWSGIRKGDKEALSKLFCLFYSQLFTYGFKIVPRQDVIKDAIQELFVTLWSQRDKIEQAYSVKSYLFHSLRRILLRNLAKHKNRINRNQVYVDNFFEEIYNVEELMIHFETKQEQRKQLSQAIKSLSNRQREAIFLKFYDGMSNTEIACVMGINQQSVYNHVSEAINRIQAYIH